MKNYNFDGLIDRRGTLTVKYGMLKENFGRTDLLPLWVADMDFATPDFILDALRERLQHPVLGYSVVPEYYWEVISKWVRERHGWDVPVEYFRYIPGIVKGIGMVVNVFTKPGDKVIVQPPVYHPFRIVPETNGRELVWNPLRRIEGHETQDGFVHYEMDFDQLAEVCDEDCKLLILCNPHNPGGVCWDRETLCRLAKFCVGHNLLVISDEIHCDMALFGHRHIPFASVSDEAARCSITFQAPSKTFNIAGLVSSYCIVSNPEIREPFFKWLEANEFDCQTFFATIATMAAYTPQGEEWRRQMLHYVEGNVTFVKQFCEMHLPGISIVPPQASFLIWLDCRALGLKQPDLVDLFVNKAGLALNDGAMFGPGGEGFMRLNVGTPRAVLTEALMRLKQALTQISQ